MLWNSDVLPNGEQESGTPGGWQETLLALAVAPAGATFQATGPFRSGSRQLSAGKVTVVAALDGLLELHRMGLVSGIRMVTPYEADLFDYREEQKQWDSGSGSDASELARSLSESPMPVLDPNSKQEPVVAFVEEEGVQLTGGGWSEAAKLADRQYATMPAAIRDAADAAIASGDFAGALGAAWLVIERALVAQLGGTHAEAGGSLITKYCASLIAASAEKPGGAPHESAKAFITTLRDELHLLCGCAASANRAGATDSKAMLQRYARAYESVNAAAKAISS